MKKNLDIYLGLLAWLIALHHIFLELYQIVRVTFEYFMWVVPLQWSCTVIAMLIFSKRPWRKLWWVWFSFPFAFAPYAALIIYDIGNAIRRL